MKFVCRFSLDARRAMETHLFSSERVAMVARCFCLHSLRITLATIRPSALSREIWSHDVYGGCAVYILPGLDRKTLHCPAGPWLARLVVDMSRA